MPHCVCLLVSFSCLMLLQWWIHGGQRGLSAAQWGLGRSVPLRCWASESDKPMTCLSLAGRKSTEVRQQWDHLLPSGTATISQCCWCAITACSCMGSDCSAFFVPSSNRLAGKVHLRAQVFNIHGLVFKWEEFVCFSLYPRECRSISLSFDTSLLT